ncbi:small ribosomal subunit biogenesis GTPase RsgA [Leptolyngbya sp. AN02str]|uniref:small ribosomal subunit biogenesis GTPase RsgA n=1 Tax=Leptolyngbya sp. AN02str TaxID=3423363 RepID=UPI003D31FB7E
MAAEIAESSGQFALDEETPLSGVVMAVQANFYRVHLDSATVPADGRDTEILLCTRRSRLKKIGQRVMVGDRVQIEEPDWAGGRGAIAAVAPRDSEMNRPAIANVDHVLLVFALADPPLEPFQLSRFLVKAESIGVKVTLCLNKRDLLPLQEQAEWRDRLWQWGYAPLLISVHDPESLQTVYPSLQQRTTLVSGPSGVGKSSLLNQLLPDVDLRVGSVSGKLRHGRHTTRHVELFELPGEGFLADSPGFNQPDVDCAPAELSHFFPEVRQRLAAEHCQFHNCLHRDEPGCVVRGDWERYEHYLVLLEEAIARQTALERSRDAESTVKQKIGSDGQIETEPKLESKRYRRPSRRTQKQALKDLVDLEADDDNEPTP